MKIKRKNATITIQKDLVKGHGILKTIKSNEKRK